MSRLLEILFGLGKGFLSQEGSLSIQFNPDWPGQQWIGGAAIWNLLLVMVAVLGVIYIYRREAKSRRTQYVLGGLRLALLGFVLILLNRPMLTISQVHRENSVLAILIDDSLSMKVPDAALGGGPRQVRLDAIVHLLSDSDGALLRQLAAVHSVRIFDFSRGVRQIAAIDGQPDSNPAHRLRVSDASVQQAIDALGQLKPDGDGTQLVSSIRQVLDQLQGQRVAGVVVLSDGRETPSAAPPEAVAATKAFGVNIFAVPVGTDQSPRNIAVQSVDYEPSAFVDDLTNFKATVRATGFEPNHPITFVLEREETHDARTVRVQLRDEAGNPIQKTVTAADDSPFVVELQYKPTKSDMPTANLVVEAKPQEGELDLDDNFRKVQLAVLDDRIAVLYVDGYPRWDYRYLKNALLRDKSVRVSCFLTSADPNFRQEGSEDPDRPAHTWAITAFPDAMEQLLDYDVVIFGDVDPREFTDAQLQMVSDFVSKKGGGFEMVAGPRWSPQDYRNTPIEPVLPVIVTHTESEDVGPAITEGFRPVLTPAGAESSIFRFFADPAANEEFLKNQIQQVFWYCRGLIVKPGVGIAYAEHPTDLGPDNRKSPILVVGRFGAGRTIFSAIDDSWRWRFYTGESVFNTYWVQQIRYLARGRKLGQRKLSLTADQDSYELGKTVSLQLRILSPELMQQLSTPLGVQIVDDATGQPVGQVQLNRQGGLPDIYRGSFAADRMGQFSAKLLQLPDAPATASYNVQTPRLELNDPRVDLPALSRLATRAPIPLDRAPEMLAAIPSAARIIPVESSQPIWNAPLVLVLLAGFIIAEWILRKMLGML